MMGGTLTRVRSPVATQCPSDPPKRPLVYKRGEHLLHEQRIAFCGFAHETLMNRASGSRTQEGIGSSCMQTRPGRPGAAEGGVPLFKHPWGGGSCWGLIWRCPSPSR